MADTSQETAVAEEEQTPEKQEFFKRETSDTLFYRWNALLDYGSHGTRVFYDPQKMLELYRQDGFDSVKEYVKENNMPQNVDAALHSALWTIFHTLINEEKCDEVLVLMQELPEEERRVELLFAGYFSSHELTKENIEKAYDLYCRLAGDDASAADFTRYTEAV